MLWRPRRSTTRVVCVGLRALSAMLSLVPSVAPLQLYRACISPELVDETDRDSDLTSVHEPSNIPAFIPDARLGEMAPWTAAVRRRTRALWSCSARMPPLLAAIDPRPSRTAEMNCGGGTVWGSAESFAGTTRWGWSGGLVENARSASAARTLSCSSLQQTSLAGEVT